MVQDGAAGLQTGADPDVLTGSFNVQAYATSRGFGTIPAEQGATKDPLLFGAVGNGIADDTVAVRAALNDIPTGTTGGVLDLSNGIFGVSDISGNDDIFQIGDRSNVTIKGGGWSKDVTQTSGVRVLDHQSANRFDAVWRYQPGSNNQDLVIKDLEIDCGSQQAGGITTQFDDGTWLINNYIHDVGDGNLGTAAAAIRGADTQTRIRIIGNLIQRTSAENSSGVRGIWPENQGPLDSVVAHNIVVDSAHTGIPVHGAASNPPTFVEFNTVVRAGQTVGSAAMKAELDSRVDTATYDETGVFTTYRRNFTDIQRSVSGDTDAGLQFEGMNILIEENIFRDSLRGLPSFGRHRKVTIQNNVMEFLDEYGIYVEDNIQVGDDQTGLFFLNNTISADGRSLITGVFFLSNFTGSIFGFGNPIQIADNKIVGASGADVVTTPALDAYVAGDPSSFITNNNSSAPGAANVLLPPSYIGSI